MLYDLWLLDVPKLLDLAALYGTGSPKLVHRLMQQVIAGRRCTCHELSVDLAAFYAPKVVQIEASTLHSCPAFLLLMPVQALPLHPTAACMMGTRPLASSAPLGQTLPLQPDDVCHGSSTKHLFLVQGDALHDGFHDNVISP